MLRAVKRIETKLVGGLQAPVASKHALRSEAD